jgi:hypothetical protein
MKLPLITSRYLSVCACLLFSLTLLAPVPAHPKAPLPERNLVLAADAQQLPMQLITIRPTGFDPAEISLRAEPFRLAIDNKSGLDEVTLRLSREGGSLVREKRLPPGQLKWREKINLPPGEYLLTEATHPDWHCRIIVTS